MVGCEAEPPRHFSDEKCHPSPARGMGTLSWKGWSNWLTAMSLAGIQNHPVTFLTKSATPPEGGEWVRLAGKVGATG